jgi:isoleucyl-tRNA synthetase
LAEAEVEYEDKTSPSIYVRFPVVDRATVAQRFGMTAGALFDERIPVSVAIWTTTPWTLPANRAVAVHPQFDYALVEFNAGAGRERLVLATELIAAVMPRWGVRAGRHREVKGAALEHMRCSTLSTIAQVPTVLGDHVTLDAGTGAVHTAPGHGLEDYVVGRRYNLETSKTRSAATADSCPRRRCSPASRCSTPTRT